MTYVLCEVALKLEKNSFSRARTLRIYSLPGATNKNFLLKFGVQRDL